MERTFWQRLTSPTGLIVGLSLIVIAVLVVLVVLLNPGAASPEPATATAPVSTATEESEAEVSPTEAAESSSETTSEETASSDAPAATVNDYVITQSYLSRTVRLNGVLGDLSNSATLDKKETLDRLIMSQLILQGAPQAEEPSQEQVDGFIGSLVQTWGVSDDVVNGRLEAAGLDRAFLEDTIRRLLTVQAGVESLEAEGHNLSEWLQQQQQDADIMVAEDLASAEEVEPTAEPTEEPEPTSSSTAPPAEVVEVAPNFTLDQAGGGTFTLKNQLAEGPVVLVFFEKCG